MSKILSKDSHFSLSVLVDKRYRSQTPGYPNHKGSNAITEGREENTGRERKNYQTLMPKPKLPVARTVWIPKPDFATGAKRWIEAGGAHHAVYTQALNSEFLTDFATIAGIEIIEIN